MMSDYSNSGRVISRLWPRELLVWGRNFSDYSQRNLKHPETGTTLSTKLACSGKGFQKILQKETILTYNTISRIHLASRDWTRNRVKRWLRKLMSTWLRMDESRWLVWIRRIFDTLPRALIRLFVVHSKQEVLNMEDRTKKIDFLFSLGEGTREEWY